MYGLIDPSDSLIQRLAWVLIHFLWQGSLVVTLLVLTTWMGRVRQANGRYILGLIALAAMAFVPVATFFMLPEPSLAERNLHQLQLSRTSTIAPAALIAEPDVKQDISPRSESSLSAVADSLAVNNLAGTSIPQSDTPHAPIEVTVPESHTDANELLSQQWWNQASAWIVCGWMIGAGLLSLRLLLGWIGAFQMRRRVTFAPTWLERRLTELAVEMRVSRPLIRLSQRVTEAVAVGFLKPMILIPVAWMTDLSPDMIEDVVVHELAHIRRGDLWINLLQRLVETLFFYHPAVWWLSRRLRIDREHCCDAIVVCTLQQPLRYAETLEQIGRLSIACSRNGNRAAQAPPSLAVSIGSSRNILLERIRVILAPPPDGRTSVASLAGLIPLLFVCLAGWLLTNRPLSQTENELIASPPIEILAAATTSRNDIVRRDEPNDLPVYTGKVVTSDGSPIPADLKLFRRLNGEDYDEIRSISVDRDGTFRFRADPACGSVRFSMQANGFASFDSRWRKLDGEMVLNLSRGAAVQIRLRPPQKVASLSGSVSLIVPGYDEDEQGSFPVQPDGEVLIPHCPLATVKLDLLVPGFEEVRIHQPVADELTIDVPLQPARATRLRVKSARTGLPIEGARLRLFRRTRADSILMPFERFGDGPVWGVSDSGGHVELTTLRSIDPVPTNDPGPAEYAFYIEAPGHAPRYIGNVRAGSDLGEISVDEGLEVQGEIVTDDTKPERVSLQFRQSTVALGGANAIGWWRTVPVKDVGGKLRFHLKGLQPGRFDLFVVYSDADRPKNTGRTFSQMQFQGMLTGNSSNLMIRQKSINPGDHRLVSQDSSLTPSDDSLTSNPPSSIIEQLIPAWRVTNKANGNAPLQQSLPNRKTLFAWSSTLPQRHSGGFIQWRMFVTSDGTLMVPGSTNDAGVHHKLSASELNEFKELLEKRRSLFNAKQPARAAHHNAWKQGHDTLYSTFNSKTMSYEKWNDSAEVVGISHNEANQRAPVIADESYIALMEFAGRLQHEAAFGGRMAFLKYREIAQAALADLVPGTRFQETDWSTVTTSCDGTREMTFRSDKNSATITLTAPVQGGHFIERIEQQGQPVPFRQKAVVGKNSVTLANANQSDLAADGKRPLSVQIPAKDEVPPRKPHQNSGFNGRIVDSDGRGVSGAEVRLVQIRPDGDAGEGAVIAKTETGENGLFQFDEIPASNCSIWVRAEGKGIGVGSTLKVSFTAGIERNASSPIKFERPRETLIPLVKNTKPIQILDPNAKPLAGAKVSVMLVTVYQHRFESPILRRRQASQLGLADQEFQKLLTESDLHEAPPADWKHSFEGATNSEGKVTLSGIEPEKLHVIAVETEDYGRQLLTVTKSPTSEHPDLVFQVKPLRRQQRERLETHDIAAARKLNGEWKLALPRGFVYQATIASRPDGLLRVSGAVKFSGVYTFSKKRLELVEPGKKNVRDFVWELQDDGTLTLIEEDHSSGPIYLGARFLPSAEINSAKASEKSVSVRGRVTIEGIIPNVPALRVQPSLRFVFPPNYVGDTNSNDEQAAKAPVLEIPDDSLKISRTGGLANVVLYLKKAPPGWHQTKAPTDPVTLTIDNYRFQRRILPIRTGQPLRFVNNMDEPTNVRISAIRSSPLNWMVKPDSMDEIRPNPFPHPESFPIQANSDIHVWMNTWILPLDHPFQAITDAEGRFEICDLPPGEHRFTVWHERRGILEREFVVRVQDGKSSELNLQYPADRFLSETPAEAEATQRVRLERRKANDRTAAETFVGRWKLKRPGAESIDVTGSLTNDGFIRFHGTQPSFQLGTFTVRGNKMELVTPESSGVLELVWEINSSDLLNLKVDKNLYFTWFPNTTLQRAPAE